MLTYVDHSVQGRLLQRVCFDSACGYEAPPLRRVTSTAVSALSPPSAVFGFHGAFVRFAWTMLSCPIAQQVPIRLYVGPHAAVCVSACCYTCVLMLLYVCPHAAIPVASYCYVCVRILLYMCPHAAMHVSSYCYMCPHTAIHASSCCYIQVCTAARFRGASTVSPANTQQLRVHASAPPVAQESGLRRVLPHAPPAPPARPRCPPRCSRARLRPARFYHAVYLLY